MASSTTTASSVHTRSVTALSSATWKASTTEVEVMSPAMGVRGKRVVDSGTASASNTPSGGPLSVAGPPPAASSRPEHPTARPGSAEANNTRT